jgi:hypothetical protein
MTSSAEYITLDEVIRLTLGKNHLPTHYYMPYLIYGKEALRTVNYISWPEIKTAPATLLNGVYTLPTDCVKAQEIYILIGDRKRPLVEDHRLAKQEGPFSDYSSAIEAQELWGDSTERQSIFQGREFDRGKDFPMSYAKLTEETFRLSTSASENIGTVYVQYTTIPKRTGTSSLLHPLAQDMVSAFIKWQWVMNGKMKRLDVKLFKDEYENAARIFRANVYNVTGDLIARTQRKGSN